MFKICTLKLLQVTKTFFLLLVCCAVQYYNAVSYFLSLCIVILLCVVLLSGIQNIICIFVTKFLKVYVLTYFQ